MGRRRRRRRRRQELAEERLGGGEGAAAASRRRAAPREPPGIRPYTNGERRMGWFLTFSLESLRALWNASFPDTELNSLVSAQWKDMGWQGVNPTTDFRGCGFISLENLLFFARTYPAPFKRLMLKQQGMRAVWEYPFAVAGINISYMLIQLLELNSGILFSCFFLGSGIGMASNLIQVCIS